MRDLDQVILPTYNVPLTVFELGVLVSAFNLAGFKVPKRIEKVVEKLLGENKIEGGNEK